MGKGDKKSRKGKIAKGSYGNARPRTANKAKATAKPKAETAN
jgi:30S ribosomal protein S31